MLTNGLSHNTLVGRCLSGIVVLGAITIASCATLQHGSTQSIQVVSDPPGAQVTIDDDPVPYIAPSTVTLKRGQDHVLVFRKSGFQDYSAELTRSTSGAVLGNIVLGGMSGMMTDYGSGAAYELGNANLVNDTLIVKLVPQPSTVSAAPSSSALVPAPKSESHPE